MHKQNIIMLFLLVYIIAACGGPAVETKEGWTNLFDGKTLNGWTIMDGEAEFSIEDGVIVGTAVANTPNTFLVTAKKFEDFILELEIRVQP